MPPLEKNAQKKGSVGPRHQRFPTSHHPAALAASQSR